MAGEFNQIMPRDENGAVLTYNSSYTTKPYFALGQTITDENGNVYEYIKTAANVAFTQYDAIALLNAGGQSITTTLAASGTRVGFTPVAVTAGGSGVYQYGWVQTKTGGQNVSSIRVGAACAPAKVLQTTSTAGILDDATGQVAIHGVTLGTVQGSAAGANATAQYAYPVCAETEA